MADRGEQKHVRHAKDGSGDGKKFVKFCGDKKDDNHGEGDKQTSQQVHFPVEAYKRSWFVVFIVVRSVILVLKVWGGLAG